MTLCPTPKGDVNEGSDIIKKISHSVVHYYAKFATQQETGASMPRGQTLQLPPYIPTLLGIVIPITTSPSQLSLHTRVATCSVDYKYLQLYSRQSRLQGTHQCQLDPVIRRVYPVKSLYTTLCQASNAAHSLYHVNILK